MVLSPTSFLSASVLLSPYLYAVSPMWGLAVILFLLVRSFVLRGTIKSKTGAPIPPGPPLRYAFLRKYPERTLDTWAKAYGPLYSVFMGNQLFVVISDPKVARDLLVTQGAIFSSRKNYFMKNQMILRGRAITASAYNDKWKHHRRLAMQFLNPKAIEAHGSSLDYEASILVRSFYIEGKRGSIGVDPSSHTGRYALNNMLTLSFGTRTDSTSSPLLDVALKLAMEFMDLTGPWSNVVDFVTPLQWIPTKMRSRGLKLHDDLIEVYGSMYKALKTRIEAGEIVPECLVRTLIETGEHEKLDWEDACMLAAVFTLGGVHSTSGLLQWFLALLPSYPDVQARAQKELDDVIGRDHWPTAEDEAQLPYIRAIIKEVQRVHSPFWNGTPHYSTEDYEYNGMFIPKDTVMVLNCFTMHHNPARYPDPETFNPDRYLGDELSCAESAKLSDPMARDHWAFGGGRRFCPGIAAAERELFLAVSRILWSFNVRALPSNPISLEEYEGKSGRTPVPFKVQLEPRHENVHGILAGIEELRH